MARVDVSCETILNVSLVKVRGRKRNSARRALVSDPGTSLVPELVAEILQQCVITHLKTTVYHPQTNGMVEGFTRTLADMLFMYVSSDHSVWDIALPFVTFAYNLWIELTTGYSPYRLHCNRNDTVFFSYDTLQCQ